MAKSTDLSDSAAAWALNTKLAENGYKKLGDLPMVAIIRYMNDKYPRINGLVKTKQDGEWSVIARFLALFGAMEGAATGARVRLSVDGDEIAFEDLGQAEELEDDEGSRPKAAKNRKKRLVDADEEEEETLDDGSDDDEEAEEAEEGDDDAEEGDDDGEEAEEGEEEEEEADDDNDEPAVRKTRAGKVNPKTKEVPFVTTERKVGGTAPTFSVLKIGERAVESAMAKQGPIRRKAMIDALTAYGVPEAKIAPVTDIADLRQITAIATIAQRKLLTGQDAETTTKLLAKRFGISGKTQEQVAMRAIRLMVLAALKQAAAE